jgi:hypothetical protein
MHRAPVACGVKPLPKLQNAFQDYLLGQSDDVAAEVNDTANADRRLLLSVYRHGYFARLHECLCADYAGVRAMLGEDEFEDVARAYVQAHPSRYTNMRWLGQHLTDFLRRHHVTKDRLDAIEMAEFEWALGLALDAADDEAMAVEELMQLSGEQWVTLTVKPRANVQRLRFSTMAPKAWLKHETTPPGELQVEQAATPIDWLVWRRDTDPQFRSMEPDEAWAFDAAASGVTFAQLCEGLANFLPADQAAARAAGLLRVWIEARLLLPLLS